MQRKSILDYFSQAESTGEPSTTKITRSESNIPLERPDLKKKKFTENIGNSDEEAFFDTPTTDTTILADEPSFLQEEKPKKQLEERFPFLTDVRDKNGRRPGEPGYDPTTLYISEEDFKRLTPFEKQFWSIKKNYFDTVILFKKGKFYELYEADAELVARLFDFRVSNRVNMKMSGFPEKSYTQWASKLLELGYKIGKVEQMENAVGRRMREAEGREDKLVRRVLTEVVTSGTIYDPEYLRSSGSLYIGSAVIKGVDEKFPCISVILYDASINRLYVKEFNDAYGIDSFKTILVQRNVKELLISKRDMERLISVKYLLRSIKIVKPSRDECGTERKYDFGSDGLYLCFIQLLNYMTSLCRGDSLENAEIREVMETECMSLDMSTLKNLEILSNNYDGSEKNSLFNAINYCVTPMGERLLRRWLLSPLTNLKSIMERRAEAELFEGKGLSLFSENAVRIGDLERRLGRMSNPSPTVRDLKCFLNSVRSAVTFLLFMWEEFLQNVTELQIKANCLVFHSRLTEFIEHFERSYRITEDDVVPGPLCPEDELIASLHGELKKIREEFRVYLDELKRRTGIVELVYKTVNSEIFQVEAPTKIQMPREFLVTSITKTHRRYSSPELKALVKRHEEMEEKLFQAHGGIFRKAIEYIGPYKEQIGECAAFIAQLDCYASFAKFAETHRTSVPVFVPWESNTQMEIQGLVSPIYTQFIRNDFEPKSNINIMTGPNMGGKSTFLRAISLNIILAQMGMRTTTDRMQITVFDNIFTRIGASDSLARGESTFMVELSETAKILRQSTSYSFVIMDELGRGTSTEEGSAIARAVLDFLNGIGCYVLFSTHYHMLVNNYESGEKWYVDSLMDGNDIVFLYKIKRGICCDSHGLQVAQLAGVPEDVLDEAREIKKRLLESKMAF